MNSTNSYNHKDYGKESIDNDHISQLTPSDVPTVCEITTHKYVVPIIFIPGIMGSNLKNGKTKVWYPPNKKLSEATHIAGELIMGLFRSASSRQKRLDPNSTMVGFDGPVYVKKAGIKVSEDEALRRGWGTVWWNGYGDILVYLEKHLNEQLIAPNSSGKPKFGEEWEKIVQAINSQQINSNSSTQENSGKSNEYLNRWKLKDTTKSSPELTLTEFSKLGLVDFPVYACGYNWLQSNDKSAIDVSKRMEKIKQEYSSKNSKVKFLKFLIVTHSMGGLVARSIVQQGLMADDIGGVIHGAMPSSGAPAVYQRIVKGWDGFDVSGKIADALASPIFGHNTERLTAVLANAPGALQLLPFVNFNDQGDYDWLKFKIGNRIVQVPIGGNPYSTIYAKQGVWWEMVNSDLVDPSGKLEKKLEKEKKVGVIDFYLENIKTVKLFHKNIQDSFHDKTYANYGADPNHKATGDIIWKADEESTPDLLCLTDDTIINLGSKEIIANKESPYVFNDRLRKVSYVQNGVKKQATFTLEIELRSPGDGTVCFQSGQDVRATNRKLIETFQINGFEHSASYNHPDVQLNTIYCVSKLLNQLINDCEVGKISFG